jgi:hypothetical protein
MRSWYRRILRDFRGTDHFASDTSQGGVYSGLRHQALSIKRSDVSIPKPSYDAPVWGSLMEMGLQNGTATLFASSDGSASLYFSNGGGVLGGGEHESVRRASKAFIAMANQYYQQMTPCDAYPLPLTGYTVFYLLTDSGVLTGSALEDDLGHNRHPLSPLFHAGHEVISQLRQISMSAS